MTHAEEIRAAAQKIRDVAAKATPGPWTSALHGSHADIDALDGHTVAEAAACTDHTNRWPTDAAHIALWHPGVAELVAQSLDCWAGHFDHIEWINNRPGDTRTRIAGFNRHEQAALDLARAINQGSKP